MCVSCMPLETYSSHYTMLACHVHMQADEALAASTGNVFEADPEQHGWRYGMEPVTGLTLYVSCPAFLVGQPWLQYLTPVIACS